MEKLKKILIVLTSVVGLLLILMALTNSLSSYRDEVALWCGTALLFSSVISITLISLFGKDSPK